ncbi:MAG TPA: sodium:solute symporter [Bacteroidales bacterium]|nr:sodium:solute symporter [Bacteroidales bacterium]
MNLNAIDVSIIGIYLILTVVIGLLLQRVAAKSKKNYMLGGNRLPWYMLGLSNASGMFDISGTMWLVAIMFVYGMKSIWIPWLWPVFNQIFLMVFLSAWLRRSNASTGAEWISTRFGLGPSGKLSHTIVVIFALISCLGFLAYGFIGLGKFVEIFIPYEWLSQYLPFSIPERYVPHFYGLIFTLFAVFYSVLGGMSGIVWADVLQYVIMTISAIVIGILAFTALGQNQLNVPEGWMNPFFGKHLNLDWSRIIPEVNDKIRSDGYSLFSIFFTVMLFKGLLVSLAGPAPNYDMQKILSTRSPKEAAKMSGFVTVVLMPIRYLLIGGIAVLALLYYNRLDLTVGGRIDFEQILPSAINEFAPVGFTGLLLAGLLAAFMGTFAGTLNAAQAYVVNDIYLKYINPGASNKRIRNTNYFSGLLVVSLSIIIGFFALDVNSILQWIVSALFGSYVASNILKWYWWRFNGYGFFWGMVAGLVPALIFPYIFKDTLSLWYFPLILVISIIGCFAGTLLTRPVEEETLKSFYYHVKPWGFWKPVREKVQTEHPDFRPNPNFKRDMFNVFIGTIAQTALVAAPLYLVLRKGLPLTITLIIIAVTFIILKKTWWNTLSEYDQ